VPSVDLSLETLARLEAQLQADLDAVRRVRALLAAPKISTRPSPAPQPAAAPAPAEEKFAPAPAAVPPAHAAPSPPAYVPPPPITVAVPQVVALMEGEFGIKALKAVLAREHLGGHPDREIRRVLNRMVKSGELRVVSASVGRGGSTYQRVTQG
jgi:hypothetical protein